MLSRSREKQRRLNFDKHKIIPTKFAKEKTAQANSDLDTIAQINTGAFFYRRAAGSLVVSKGSIIIQVNMFLLNGAKRKIVEYHEYCQAKTCLY